MWLIALAERNDARQLHVPHASGCQHDSVRHRAAGLSARLEDGFETLILIVRCLESCDTCFTCCMLQAVNVDRASDTVLLDSRMVERIALVNHTECECREKPRLPE